MTEILKLPLILGELNLGRGTNEEARKALELHKGRVVFVMKKDQRSYGTYIPYKLEEFHEDYFYCRRVLRDRLWKEDERVDYKDLCKVLGVD